MNIIESSQGKFNKNRVKKGDISFMSNEFGKIPPQAIEMEEAVLGAMMLEKNAVNAVIDVLKPESFYKEGHQHIFRAMMTLFQATEPIDLLTVTSQLRKDGMLEIVGGAYYITQLTNRVGSAANAEYHARIVSQKFIQRELIRISAETVKNAYEDTSDVFELLDTAESNLFAIAESNIRKNYDSMSTLVSQAIKQIETAMTQKDGLSGVPSGFTELDRVTNGWQKSDLIVLAARPGMGKTAFVLSLARNIAVEFNKPIAVFSLEMSSVQLVNRLISSETEFPADKLRKGDLKAHEWQQLNSQISKLTAAPMFIDDTPALNIFELRAKCRRLKAQHDIQMVVIDYLQLMTAGGEGKGNREQEISSISRSLKSIAKELDIPIIALSQLSRAVETRGGNKRPQLSDLRESGAIEQDADMVLFIYRPEYYQLYQDEQGNSTEGMAELIIAKHRNGSLKDVKLRFVAHLAKFQDYDSQSYNDDGNSGFPLKPNYDFNNPPSITLASKINDIPPSDDAF
ncbi:MAG: replicative DNA helicase [Bacteroidota bacterium]|jgi:replicative DNA helicase